MTSLMRLHDEQGQSPWVDNLQRSYLTDGALSAWIDKGVRGVTSNPTIFQKAIEASSDYDEQFKAALGTGTVEDAYWELVIRDVEGALELFSPMHLASGGEDGLVSLEVSPALADDTEATVRSALWLHQRIARPNLLVKIPATPAGVPAIRRMIAAGHSINVTLIFSLERYAEVIEAYLSGLEELVGAGGDPSKVRSVASFFVSRVDTEVDRRIDAMLGAGPGDAEALRSVKGRVAVAQAKMAYRLFAERFTGARWEALAQRGANVQRPLWASTSTKNPAYADLLYVDNLIGPDTVNTMPEATLTAFLDHGAVARTVDVGVDAAMTDMARLAELGIDIADVSLTLEQEGVASFAKSFDELMASLSDKAGSLDR